MDPAPDCPDHSAVAPRILSILEACLNSTYRRSFSGTSLPGSAASSDPAKLARKKAKLDSLYQAIALEDLRSSFLSSRATASSITSIPLGRALNASADAQRSVPELRPDAGGPWTPEVQEVIAARSVPSVVGR